MPQVSEEYLEKRKNNIAKFAINVFARKGYSNASMKDIMKEAEVSRGGLYAHFANIDAVFIAALKYDDSIQATALLEPNIKDSFLTQLKNWIYQVILSSLEKNNLIRAKSEFFLSQSVKEVPYLQERYEKLSQSIQQLIQLGITQGEFKKEIDLASFSDLLISMIDGVMLHQYYQYSSNTDVLKLLTQMDKVLESYLI
ncbi:TetR/AcrR family transcriptional regulator [Tetragenococcus halophilus]|uniref:TetR/AcrR family transcriptional regulator n=1 Tax=Tetragenococcus halophilus TaxID=51669 RepID=UPI00209BB65D|nr:TetR family transcriptional regulator [Tetragenococcus halophilus]MCO8291807.1 TetR family transcriptional regulator [Tetragenococcus halophilus]